MSLDNIQIPPFITAQLFRNSLVDTRGPKADETTVAATSIAFLGNNEQHITVVVTDPSAIYLAETSLGLLIGILSACKLSMKDIALVNYSNTLNLHYEQLNSELGAEKILLFGTSPADIGLPISFPHFQSQQYNGRLYLAAPTLPELEADRSKKLNLWNCLKTIFALS